MKPGDAVLVEAKVEVVLRTMAEVTPLVGIELGWSSIRVPLSEVHALPDEATRRRAAELARNFDEISEARRNLIETDPTTADINELAMLDYALAARALRLLAGNAAEDKPA